ncbi:MAG: dihydroneopterin aldolase [Candidatus Bathyarchaeota archaeon]|nr:dihydroneopterin aldolase [Candidatus Bathyarchaeota archaeon]
MDKIFVKNLVLPCKVGVTEDERSNIQNVILDIEVFCDLRQAGATDDFLKGIDYEKIVEIATTTVTKGEFVLLERLVEKVASQVLENLAVSGISVAVKKEKYSVAPIIGIELHRGRHD